MFCLAVNADEDIVTDNMVPVSSSLAVDASRARSTSRDTGSVDMADEVWQTPLLLRLRPRVVGGPVGQVVETKPSKKTKKDGRGRKE